MSDLEGMKPGDTLPIIESMTGKPNALVVNKVVHKALTKYLKDRKRLLNYPVFAGGNTPRISKGWQELSVF